MFFGVAALGLGQRCDPGKPAPPGTVCQTLLGQTINGVVDGAMGVMASYGHALRDEGVGISARLGRARTTFFQTPPNSPNFAKVQEEFATCLMLKDLWFLKVFLFPQTAMIAKPYLEVDYMDGGLREGAIPAFEYWAGRVKDHAGPQMMGLLEFRGGSNNQTVTEALNSLSKEYERYRLARDWGEFALAGRNVSDDPEIYGKFLVAIITPDGEAWYRSFVDVFGKDTVIRASKRYMAAPKERDGFLRSAMQVNGMDWTHPEDVFLQLLGEGSGRNYVLTVLTGARGSCGICPNTAAREYQRWVAAYGEKAVVSVGERIRVAPKFYANGRCKFKDPASLGVPVVDDPASSGVDQIYRVFQDMLAVKDPKGFVRVMVAFHDGADSSSAVDAGYEKLASRYGAEAVATAATKIRSEHRFDPSVYYTYLIATLDPSAVEMKTETTRGKRSAKGPELVLRTTPSGSGAAPHPDTQPTQGAPPSPSTQSKQPYAWPDMPNYYLTEKTAGSSIQQFCRGIYSPVDPLLTPDQSRFAHANASAVQAEVQKCISGFDVNEVITNRRVAMRYCFLTNDYTRQGNSMKAYNDCMNQNDIKTALCTRELNFRSKLGPTPNFADQSCPVERPNGRESLVIRNGGNEDGGKPIVAASRGPGLPKVVTDPMEPGIIFRSGSGPAVAPTNAAKPPPGSVPSAVQPASVQSAAVQPPPAPTTAVTPQLSDLRQRYADLVRRSAEVKTGLAQVEQQLARQRLGLRRDIVNARSSMDTQLRTAAESIGRADADRAEQSLQYAEAALETLEKFLGR
jgi:hypothetical protein